MLCRSSPLVKQRPSHLACTSSHLIRQVRESQSSTPNSPFSKLGLLDPVGARLNSAQSYSADLIIRTNVIRIAAASIDRPDSESSSSICLFRALSSTLHHRRQTRKNKDALQHQSPKRPSPRLSSTLRPHAPTLHRHLFLVTHHPTHRGFSLPPCLQHCNPRDLSRSPPPLDGVLENTSLPENPGPAAILPEGHGIPRRNIVPMPCLQPSQPSWP